MSSADFATIEFPVELPAVRVGDHWIARAGEKEIRLTNLNKVFWPERGYTKGDLLTYYFNVATLVLPHVMNRPLTLRRTPEGVGGPYFYEKDAPAYTPDWVQILPVRAHTQDRVIRFVSITDIASLLWVANIGCIELHPHHTRGVHQEHPTYAVFDLDPFPPAAWEEVVHVARLIAVLLGQLRLQGYPKSSGGEGLQIYVPLSGVDSYETVRQVVTQLCLLVNRADSETTTLAPQARDRSGKVFLDANMNRAGASFAAAYSVRERWGAPVSTPLEWSELEDVEPGSFTIAAVMDRFAEKGDLFEPVAGDTGQSLEGVRRQLRL